MAVTNYNVTVSIPSGYTATVVASGVTTNITGGTSSIIRMDSLLGGTITLSSENLVCSGLGTNLSFNRSSFTQGSIVPSGNGTITFTAASKSNYSIGIPILSADVLASFNGSTIAEGAQTTKTASLYKDTATGLSYGSASYTLRSSFESINFASISSGSVTYTTTYFEFLNLTGTSSSLTVTGYIPPQPVGDLNIISIDGKILSIDNKIISL